MRGGGLGGGVKLQIMGPVLKNVTLKWCAPHTGSLGRVEAEKWDLGSAISERRSPTTFSLSVSQPRPPKKIKNSGVRCRVESGHVESLLPLRNAIADETQADVRQ